MNTLHASCIPVYLHASAPAKTDFFKQHCWSTGHSHGEVLSEPCLFVLEPPVAARWWQDKQSAMYVCSWTSGTLTAQRLVGVLVQCAGCRGLEPLEIQKQLHPNCIFPVCVSLITGIPTQKQ